MSDEQRLRKRVIQIEELLSHQEHVIQQLNDVVLQLRAEHDSVTLKLQQRIDRLETQIDTLSSPYDPNEKPPHY